MKFLRGKVVVLFLLLTLLVAATVYAAAGFNVGTMYNMGMEDIVDGPFGNGVKALDFDGSDDYVGVPYDASLNFTSDFSVNLWAKLTKVDFSGGNEYVFSRYDYGSNKRSFAVRIAAANPGKWDFITSSNGTTVGCQFSGTGFDAVADDWHMYTFVYSDVNNKLYMYKDGGSVIEAVCGTNPYSYSTDADVWIGGLLDVSSNPVNNFEGRLSNIAVWDTEYLSALDVSNLYNSGAGLRAADLSPSGNANLISNWLWSTSLVYPAISDDLTSAPTVSVNGSPAQQTSGLGDVDISVTVSDDDADDVKLKIEYKAGMDCFSGTSYSTIDAVDISATSGTPSVNNSAVDNYRITGISTASANTVLFDWQGETDVSDADDTYCIKITPNDGGVDGSPAMTSVTLDNVNPTASGNLTLNTRTTSSLTFDYGVAGSDTNLNYYQVHYKAGASGVVVEDTPQAAVDAGSYNPDGTTVVSGLNPDTQYVANIWTYDDYGNSASAVEVAAYTLANVPGAPTVAAVSTTSLNAIIDQNSNPSNTVYAIKVGSQYVQADGSLGESEVWQTYAVWGGASGKNITGLSANTSYAVSVKARNGDAEPVETALSSETAHYTHASAVTIDSLTNATTKSAYGVSLTWSGADNPTGLKIDMASNAGSCDENFDIGVYDNTTAKSASPLSITSSVSAGLYYKVRIASYNGSGDLNTSEVATSSCVTMPPAQPTGLTTSDADVNYITWGWGDVTGATNYRIYKNSDDTYIGETGGDTETYTQTTVADGGAAISSNTQYTVYVRPVGASGEGIASSQASAYTTADLPVSLSHASDSQTTSAMKWTWASGGAQKDFYAYSTIPEANSGYITDLYWSQSGFSTNTSYTFFVKARNAEDALTSAVSSSAYTAQTLPTGISFSSVATTSMTVTATGSFVGLETASSGIRFQNSTTSADNTFQTESWSNTSLTPNTQYTYVVSAKNGDGDETSTVTDSKWTLANVPGATSVGTPGLTSLVATIALNSNPATTEFAIYEVGTEQYVQVDGTLGESAVWQSYTTWGGASGQTVSGLSVNTSYEFKTKARNGEATPVETAFGTSSSSYTLVEAVSAPTVDGATATTLDVTIATGDNPSTTTYSIYESGTEQYVQADESLGVSAVWQTAATWGTVTVTGLSVGTSYSFVTTARNADEVEADASDSASLYTLVNVPASLALTADSSTQITAVWEVNSNPSGTEYYIENITGSANSGWITAETWSSTGLTCGTSYSFYVKARNVSLVETAFTETVSASTSDCAGGGVILPSSSSRRSRSSGSNSSLDSNDTDDPDDADDTDKIDVGNTVENEVDGSTGSQSGSVETYGVEGGIVYGDDTVDNAFQSVLAEHAVYYAVNDDSGSFSGDFIKDNLDEYVTRASAVKSVCLMMGIDLDSSEYSLFVDVMDRIFNDVLSGEYWYSPYIGVAKVVGFVNGNPDDTFRPGDPVNRAEILKMIVSANKWDLVTPESESSLFEHVSTEEWYAPYVQTAFEHGMFVADSDSGGFDFASGVSLSEFLEMIRFVE